MQHKRIGLTVEAIFSVEGALLPKKILCAGDVFAIDRIVRVEHRCPLYVPAIAPLEYTVIVDGVEKKIYYESDSNTWFSVRECS